MAYNRKEQSFLKDLQNDEKNCAEKYRQASECCCDPTLKGLFDQIQQEEQGHYDTVTQMLDCGCAPREKPAAPCKKGRGGCTCSQADLRSKADAAGKARDAYLLADLLATEKYISAGYNTAVFEFTDEASRQTLSGIQQQEQHHGKQLADYMQANGMYC